MELGDFLVKFLGKNVNFSLFVFASISVLPKFDLGKDLVGE